MNKEIWKKNLEAMEKWYPSFADMIREEKYTKDEIEVEIELSLDGEKVFRIKKDNRQLYLGGKRNAKEPVKLWIERIGILHKYTPFFLFGLGSGAYLKALVQNTEKEVNIVAYEPSISIFITMLEEIDISEEIENRPIAFVVEGLNDEEFDPIMKKVVDIESMGFLREEVHPNYKEIYGETLLKYVKPLQRMVQNIRVNYNTGVLFSKNMAQNVLHNMKYAVEGYNTKKLSDAIPHNGAGILVAAGPSLNKNIMELKKAKGKAFIVAVDTAIKPLVKAGIMPDAFFTIDPHKPLDLIAIDGAENIPVIAPTCAHYPLLDHQKGKKIFYFDNYIIPYRMYERNKKKFYDVSNGGSVACCVLSLLYKMGFNTIILVGQDLAYTDNKTHADGTFAEKMEEKDTRNMHMVKGNYEEKVPTLMNLRIYLEWFEKYIEGMKKYGSGNVRVINATEGGAYIEGTELMTLKEAIEKECNGEEIDFQSCIEHMESEFSDEERRNAAEYLHSIPEKYEEIKKGAKLLKKAYQSLEKSSKSGNWDKEKYLKTLNKIKKLIQKCYGNDGFQLIDLTMPSADYIIRSEYYYENDDVMKDMQETAQKGIKYSELLETAAGLLKKLAEDTLLDIPLERNTLDDTEETAC
ncbi:6-hydroxymethylpterin diphosphokinase MptE-like protein [Lachnospiraceae bacterium JLR.KK009]|jgi:Uncharacterized protein conserved in bacteria|nr:hypothetical protein C810_03341 [Lachnospiraceae bacterium A2]